MRNIPFFDTQFGVASLVLKEIPYSARAYITVQSALDLDKLLQECVSFCRMVGAEEIYASGDSELEKYPFYTALWHMRSDVESLGETDASLWPVQEESAEQFRRIYNEKAKKLPISVWMDNSEVKNMLKQGDGYFVHKDGILLGIGRVKGEEIRFLASVQTGAGEDVVRALTHAINGETAVVEVASINHKAVELYRRLGFIHTAELSRWYKIK